ncbi:MAG: hypothetical protein B6I28_04300 [Fusobacteriia bacterium 4572_132]|nr:MAG: hypothetical protein B6I28_04300 [Fusobacteriia bacterium 4572_132]
MIDEDINEMIEKIGMYINRKNYFNIKIDGEIKEKKINLAIPLLNVMSENENKEEIKKIIYEKYIWKNEFKKRRDIKRLSKYSIEKVKTNYFKTLLKGEFTHAIRYGNELFLRDKDEFEKISLFYGMINNQKSYLLLYIISSIELFKKVKKENYIIILNSMIDLMSKYKKDFTLYEKIESGKYEENQVEKDNIYSIVYKYTLDYFFGNYDHPKKDTLYKILKVLQKSEIKLELKEEKIIYEKFI